MRATSGATPGHNDATGKRRRPDRRRLLADAGLPGEEDHANGAAPGEQRPPEPHNLDPAHNRDRAGNAEHTESQDSAPARSGSDGHSTLGASPDKTEAKAKAEPDAAARPHRAGAVEELEGLERVEEFDSLDDLDAFDHTPDHTPEHRDSGRDATAGPSSVDKPAPDTHSDEPSWDDPRRRQAVWRGPHGLAELLASAADIREVSEPLGVGEHVCEVRQVRFVDGSHGVYKPASGEYQNPVLFGLARGEPAIREVAASALDRLLGLGVVPPTVLWDGPQGEGSLQRWIHPSEPGWDVDEYAQLDRERLAVLDYLTANNDRHWGNYLSDPHGHAVAIDHGYCFPPEPRMIIRSGFVLDRLQQPLSDTILDPIRAVTPHQLRARLAEAGLDPAAIEGTLERFTEIREHGMITGHAWPLGIADPHDPHAQPRQAPDPSTPERIEPPPTRRNTRGEADDVQVGGSAPGQRAAEPAPGEAGQPRRGTRILSADM